MSVSVYTNQMSKDMMRKKFTKTFDLSQIAEDPMDSYLDTLGLWKKRIARDGSCLFRAVAEQIYPCQSYHERVRQECVRYMSDHRSEYSKYVSTITFDEYLEAMKNPLEYGSQLEVAAMSKLYKRDFIIFQNQDQPGIDVTQNDYPRKIYLCYSYNNHFDAIFTKSHRDRLALIQSLVYEILYDKVFGSGEQVSIARRLLRKSDTIYPKEYMNIRHLDEFGNEIEYDDEESLSEELLSGSSNAINEIEDGEINENDEANEDDEDEEEDDDDEENDEEDEEEGDSTNKLTNEDGTDNNDINNNDTKTKNKNKLKNKKSAKNTKKTDEKQAESGSIAITNEKSNAIHKMPLPYKVAKSLDPVIYRNTAFDAWLAAKKEHEEAINQKAISMLQPGDKCLIKLNNNYSEKWTLAYVQSMLNDAANVFVPELNEHHCIGFENLKACTNLNDMSLLHQQQQPGLHQYNQSFYQTGPIQNVQKLVQSINSQFSKIFVNSDAKRRNVKKKQFSMKKSSSFHAFSTELPTLLEVEEQNDELFLYGGPGHHYYMNNHHHQSHHHPHHHLGNPAFHGHHGLNAHHHHHHNQSHHHHGYPTMTHSQTHPNFTEYLNSVNKSNNSSNANSANAPNKQDQNNSTSNLNNLSSSSSNAATNTNATNANSNNNKNNRRQRYSQGSNQPNANTFNYPNNNNGNKNQPWTNNFMPNGPAGANQTNPLGFHQHHPHPMTGPIGGPLGGPNQQHMALATGGLSLPPLGPLVGPPNQGFMQPPPLGSHLHPHPGHHPNPGGSMQTPPPQAFIHHPGPPHSLGPHAPPPAGLSLQHRPPNFYNPISSPFMFAPPPPPPQGVAPPPPPSNLAQSLPHMTHHLDHQNNPTYYFPSANNPLNANQNNPQNAKNHLSSSSSMNLLDQRKRHDSLDTYLNKPTGMQQNSFQQVPQHLTGQNPSQPNNNSINTQDLGGVQPVTQSLPPQPPTLPPNTSNYLLMPAPPANTTSSNLLPQQPQSMMTSSSSSYGLQQSNTNNNQGGLTRSHSYHAGVSAATYETQNTNNTNNSGVYVDVYMQNQQQQQHQSHLNQNSSNSSNLTNGLNNMANNNQSNTLCLDNNGANQLGYQNTNANTVGFPGYEIQYSRFDNNNLNNNTATNTTNNTNTSNTNGGLIDENLFNSTDLNRQTNNANNNNNNNLWNKPNKLTKSMSLFTDMMYAGDNQPSIISNGPSNQPFCYTNCFVVNIDGPINFNATHSLQDDGSDLPYNDINTIRFFYNLGIEYYRLNIATPYGQPASYSTCYAPNAASSNGAPSLLGGTNVSGTLVGNVLNQSQNNTNPALVNTNDKLAQNQTSNNQQNQAPNTNNSNVNNNLNTGANINEQLIDNQLNGATGTQQQVVPNNLGKDHQQQPYNSRRVH